MDIALRCAGVNADDLVSIAGESSSLNTDKDTRTHAVRGNPSTRVPPQTRHQTLRQKIKRSPKYQGQMQKEDSCYRVVLVVERREAAQKDVRYHPDAPHVHLLAVRPTLQDFRRHVPRRAACRVQHGVLRAKLYGRLGQRFKRARRWYFDETVTGARTVYEVENKRRVCTSWACSLSATDSLLLCKLVHKCGFRERRQVARNKGDL